MAVQGKKTMKELYQERMKKDNEHYRRVGSLWVSDLSNVKFYKMGDGMNFIDILPYTSGPNDPVAPGDPLTFVLRIFLHKDAGQNGEDLICMEKTFGGKKFKCPVCKEYQRRIDIGASEAEVKACKPQGWPRTIYNVYDRKDPGKGAQVWNTSAFMLQQYLDVICQKQTPAGPTEYIAYMDPSMDGRTIAFDKQGKEEKTRFIGVHFEERATAVPDAVLNQVKILDQLIAWPTYAQTFEDYWGVPFTGDEEAPVKGRAVGSGLPPAEPPESRASKFEAKPEPQDVPEPEEEKAEEAPEESDEDREMREAEEKLAEAKRKKAEKAAAEKKAVEKPAEEKKESKKEPKKEPPVASGGNKCPHGHKFGADIDEKPECNDCKSWKDCAKEQDRLERESRG